MRKYGIRFCLVTRAHRRTCIKWLCPKSNSKKFVTLCTFESMTSRDLFIMIFIILWGKSDCQNKGSALTQSHYLFRAITILEFNQILTLSHWDFLCSDCSNLNLMRWWILVIVTFLGINSNKITILRT